MMHPGEVEGIWVDAALVHKTEEGFMFIPVDKQLKMLDAWLWETKQWIERIEAEKQALKWACTDKDPYLRAFPKNTASCWNFNRRCPYMDCCKAWPNPLGKQMPNNMIVNKWNPLAEIGPMEGFTDAED
jgi:hypothetical protein